MKDPRFKMDEKVYAIFKQERKKTLPCGFCGGTGNIIGKNKEVDDCPRCLSGREYLDCSVWEFNKVGELVVEGIEIVIMKISSRKETFFCKRVFSTYRQFIDSKDLFKTEEEARAECLKRNQE